MVSKIHPESKTGRFHCVHRQGWGGVYRQATLWNQTVQLGSLAIIQAGDVGGNIIKPPLCRVAMNVCQKHRHSTWYPVGPQEIVAVISSEWMELRYLKWNLSAAWSHVSRPSSCVQSLRGDEKDKFSGCKESLPIVSCRGQFLVQRVRSSQQ